MSNKILSIIVPSYNMEAYLPKCLGSLVVDDPALLQKLEVIVVNDGSRDRTSEIAHEFESRYPGVFRVIDKPNGHYGSCINAALPVATGTYVKVLDADDYAFNDALSGYIRFLCGICVDDASPDVVFNNYAEVDTKGTIIKATSYKMPLNRVFKLNEMKERQDVFIGLHAIAYRLAMLRAMKYQQTEGCPYTDTEWFTVPMAFVHIAAFYNNVAVAYLVGRDGQSMDARNYINNFNVVESLVSDICMNVPRLISKSPPESRDFFLGRIALLSTSIYRNTLIGVWGYRAQCNLLAFDALLKNSEETIYNRKDDLFVHIGPIKFRYIHEWRRFQTDKTLKFTIFRLFLKALQKYLKMKGKIK